MWFVPNRSWETEIVPNRSCAIMYPIDDRCALWDLHDRRALWFLCFLSFSSFQLKSDKSSMFVGYVWAIFLNFVGLFSWDEILLWAFFKGWKKRVEITKVCCSEHNLDNLVFIFISFNFSYFFLLFYFTQFWNSTTSSLSLNYLYFLSFKKKKFKCNILLKFK